LIDWIDPEVIFRMLWHTLTALGGWDPADTPALAAWFRTHPAAARWFRHLPARCVAATGQPTLPLPCRVRCDGHRLTVQLIAPTPDAADWALRLTQWWQATADPAPVRFVANV